MRTSEPLRSFFLYIYIVNHKFPRTEKLKSSKTIEQLFSDGQNHFKYPIKVFYLPQPLAESNQAAFAVPKRNFKLAVDRNRIKRQLREAYRLNKHLLEENSNKKYAMLFLFLGKEKPQYDQLVKAMVSVLKKLRDGNI